MKLWFKLSQFIWKLHSFGTKIGLYTFGTDKDDEFYSSLHLLFREDLKLLGISKSWFILSLNLFFFSFFFFFFFWKRRKFFFSLKSFFLITFFFEKITREESSNFHSFNDLRVIHFKEHEIKKSMLKMKIISFSRIIST